MKTPMRFIVIDDDPINIMLSRMIIGNAAGKFEIQTFEIPETGFEYIQNEYAENVNKIPAVVLLDLNMPSWSGWEFLENFDKLDDKIKRQVKIYLLSSSIDKRDMDQAKANANVVEYISKPLTPKIVSKIIAGVTKEVSKLLLQ